MVKTKKSLIYFPIALLALLLSPNIHANIGVNWLINQTHTGGISTPNDIAANHQSTSESLRAFHALGESQPWMSQFVQILNANHDVSTENFSRQIIVSIENGNDSSSIVNELITLQNADGGFGEVKGFDSTVLNTAFALEALALADVKDTPAIERAINFLLEHQNNDGSFVLNMANESAIYVTAKASQALQRFLFNANVIANVETANNYLYQNQVEGGGWATDWETAHALLAVASATADTSLYTPATHILRSHQATNGAWGDDAYTTALALRALHYVKRIQFPVEADKGILMGSVIDNNTGLPLAKVVVSLEQLSQTQTVTKNDGSFSLASLEPSDYTIKYQLAGYQSASQSVTVSKGQFAELGTIRLAPLPDVGIISGIVIDTTTGQPLSGVLVEVSGIVTAEAQTDADGYYSIVSPPGPVTVTLSMSDYDTISGTGTVAKGTTLSFSPILNPTGTTPSNPEVTIQGIVVDGDTGSPLVDALVTVVGTNHSGRTNSSGEFSLAGVTPGELTITIWTDDYQAGKFTAMAPAGAVVDLGTTHLPRAVPIPTSTLIGHVRDANTGSAIVGANISIEASGNAALATEDGSYRLEEIEVLEFKVSASAIDYLTTNYNLSVKQPGVMTFDFDLIPAAESGIEIASLNTDQPSYDALAGVQMELVLNNKEATATPVRILIKVVNEAGKIVEQVSPVINSQVTVEANGQLNTTVEWQTGRNVPGVYDVVVQAYDNESGQLLAERQTQVPVKPTIRVGGHVAFEPPITQLAAKKPVKITAKVSNQGNQPVEATTLTAKLSLKNQGYQQHKNEVTVESFVFDNELVKYPRGIERDDAGNFYMANYNNHSISKITPDGTVSDFATDLYLPIDVDFDHQGNLYVLGRYSWHKGLFRLGADGSRTEFKINNVGSSQAIEVLEDGRILVAAGNTLYAVTLDENNLSANATKLIAGGLNAPYGIVGDSQGNIFIADKSGNAVIKFANGQLSTFATEINQPYGMTIDDNDNLYVTSFGDNSLLKITPEGQKSTIATGLAGPYDVKIATDGNFVVSNYNSHEIVTITPSGEISILVQPTIHAPTALTYDASGHLYVGNWSRRNIVKLATDGVATSFSSGYPRDLLATNDGSLYWLESNFLTKMGPNDSTKTILTSKLNRPYALINAPNGNGFFVSEQYAHRISRVSETGEITPYTTLTLFTYPRSIRQDKQGNLYILSDSGYITQFTETGQINRVISDLKYPRGLAIDNEGNLLVSEYHNKRVLRIDQSNNIEVVVANLSFRPQAIAVNSQGDIVVTPLNSDTLYLIKNGEVSEYAKLNNGKTGYDMLFDSSDNLWISQYYQHQVLKLPADGSSAVSYPLINRRYSPQALSLDGSGGVFVSGYHYIQQIDSIGKVTELVYGEAISRQNVRGIALDKAGRLWTADASSGVLSRLNTDYTLDKRYASIYYPKGIAWVDNSLIVANSSMKTAILRITNPSALPEIILDGSYEQIEAIDTQTVLLSNPASVSRFELNTKELTTLASGFFDIEALTIAADGHFVVADYHYKRNELAFFESDGTARDSFIGLVSPKGLLFDAEGQLLVSNAFPNGIARVRADRHLESFSSVGGIIYMWLEADGQLLVSRGNYISELSKTGELLTNYNVPYARGLFQNDEGQLWVASESHGALLQMATDGSYQKIASGLSQPRDIEVDLEGNIHIADYSRGVVTRVNEDNSLSLVAADLPNAETMTFTSDGTLFVAYKSTKIAAFDANGERTELPTADVVPKWISGLTNDSQGNLYPVIAEANKVLKMTVSQPADTKVEPGEVIYTKTVEIPKLSLAGEAISVDFGAWTPTLSGDFMVEVTAAAPTTAQLNNHLHVGPSANGTLSLAQAQVFPGDRTMIATLSIQGADSTSITQIDAQGTTLAAPSGTGGYGIAADNQGNIYSVDRGRKRIVKITPAGTVSDFITNLTIGYGLAIDAQDHIYAINAKNILKITPPSEDVTTPQVTTLVTLSGNVGAVAVGYDNQVYAVDSSNRLSRIAADGSSETITTVGINSSFGVQFLVVMYLFSK